MSKLNELISKCKCGIHINVNQHRDYYESVSEHFNSDDSIIKEVEYIDEDVFKKMIETNTIISIHFYPRTPVSYYKVYHYDMDMAINKALNCIYEEQKP